MVLADHNVWSFAEEAVITAGVVLAALLPVLVVQMRANRRMHDRTYRHVNNVEEAERVPNGEGGEAPSLGQVLRQVERKVDSGFKRNDETHAAIIRTVEAQAELLHDHGRRLDAHREEIDRLKDDRA